MHVGACVRACVCVCFYLEQRHHRNRWTAITVCVRVMYACVCVCVCVCVNKEPSLYETVIFGWSLKLSEWGLITRIKRRLSAQGILHDNNMSLFLERMYSASQ